MAFGVPWGTPFYLGGGTTTDVPTRFHVAIAGRSYMLDTASDDAPAGWYEEDIPVQRAQADTEADPGEGTLNSEGLWRRTRSTWHEGAGQVFADRPDSRAARYAESSSMDPWTKNELRLLPAVVERVILSNSTQYLALAAERLYVLTGSNVRFNDNEFTAPWTVVTGAPASPPLSIASDGSTVYIACGADGVYTIDAGATVMTSFATGTATAVAYAKGRLLVLETSGADPRVYNVTAAGAITGGNLLLTVPNLTVEAGQWVAEGPNALYIAGAVGDKTRLWRTAVKPDGTALDVPTPAGQLPDGQIVRAVCDYLGSVMLVGTDDHVFLMDYDGDGNLVIRGNLEAEGPVRAFEPQAVDDGLGHVWYGRGDATLGRINLASNVADDAFVPAQAPDLTAGGVGPVRSIATYANRRIFTVDGRGVYAGDPDNLADSGTLDLGVIGFGIGDLKNVLHADVRHEPLPAGASVQVEVAEDGGAWILAGSSATLGAVSATIGLGQRLAETVRIRLTLTGGAVVTMVTVRAVPAPKVGVNVRLYLRFFANVEDIQNKPQEVDVTTELDYLRDLREARTAVTVQLGNETFTGIVDRLVRFVPHSAAIVNGVWSGTWNGTLVLDIKKVEA